MQLLRDVQQHVQSDLHRMGREVAEHVATSRGDYHRLVEEQASLHRRVKLLGEQWAYGGGRSSFAEEATDSTTNNHNSSSAIADVRDASARCAEEVERLRLSLFDDRLLREERQRAVEAEDDAMEQRLRRIEASNDSLRLQIGSLMELLHNTANPTTNTMQSDAAASQSLPMFRLEELEALAMEADESLSRVQTEHATLQAKLESLEKYVEKEEEGRRKRLASLEESLARWDQDQKSKKEALTRLPFQLGGGGDSKGSEPSSIGGVSVPYHTQMRNHNADLSLDWLTQRRQQPGASAASASSSFSAHPTTTPLYPSAAAASAQLDSSRTQMRQRLVLFYTVHNPAKLSSIDDILEEYRGAEAELMAALEMHYGCFGYFSSM